MTSEIYELRCHVRVTDTRALWDFAAAKALAYPDTTPETIDEMIGPRDDIDVTDCLLFLSHMVIKGCEILKISCSSNLDKVNLELDVPTSSFAMAS